MIKALLLLSILVFSVRDVVLASDSSHYVNEWAAEIHGGVDHAKRVARDHGYEFIREVHGFDDHYVLRHNAVPSRSKRSAAHHTKRLVNDKRVQWVEQQIARSREKRGFLQDRRSEENKVYRDLKLNDPLWKDQWYLYDTREDLNEPKRDLHVIPVWGHNYTGEGIIITILDDGLEWNHTDLHANYDPVASFDVNDNDPDPFPRYDYTNENKHGTRCAGEVSMIANNGICGVGVAPKSKIGGVRMLDGKVTDHIEAAAIGHNCTYIDIYSASWGPNDDGLTVEGPGHLAKKAFERCIKEGRGGKGVLYVWASGNGGRLHDNCDCDGYTGSIYTLSISSASISYHKPWYGERCASTMATAFSSGSFGESKIVSTDLHNKCTDQHSGTSAAAPLAAGIFALLLEANPSLTWRDVQHLVAWTSQVDPIEHNKGWNRNAAGFLVNTAFGFGVLDGSGLVTAGKTWPHVPEKAVCVVKGRWNTGFPAKLEGPRNNKRLEVEIETSGCKGQENEINVLEHVILDLTMAYTKRGDIDMFLVSPKGTKVMLLSKRQRDRSTKGYKKWPLMSVHTWGEHPRGKWRVIIVDDTGNENRGEVQELTLTLHGTKAVPSHMQKGPRTYNKDYNLVQNEKKDVNQRKPE
ncbi:neuroendocrine convertase 1-like isoform X2 [Gigantopelta aegis]|uniref:neuroendocrine convertase 1-like isoform X2 n=1 Tax=Gigantopelta aegis TaxID=1735272 RepID=UPI001B88BD48|nr:neuroendocrine convertase 1-like isoform X2 [Gigantopelta aegis]